MKFLLPFVWFSLVYCQCELQSSGRTRKKLNGPQLQLPILTFQLHFTGALESGAWEIIHIHTKGRLFHRCQRESRVLPKIKCATNEPRHSKGTERWRHTLMGTLIIGWENSSRICLWWLDNVQMGVYVPLTFCRCATSRFIMKGQKITSPKRKKQLESKGEKTNVWHSKLMADGQNDSINQLDAHSVLTFGTGSDNQLVFQLSIRPSMCEPKPWSLALLSAMKLHTLNRMNNTRLLIVIRDR